MTFTNKVVPSEEQETVIQFNRDSDTATIYTTDSTVINKLDKKYERTRIHRSGKQIAAVEYDVPKKLVSFRLPMKKVERTEKQKEQSKNALNKAHKMR